MVHPVFTREVWAKAVFLKNKTFEVEIRVKKDLRKQTKFENATTNYLSGLFRGEKSCFFLDNSKKSRNLCKINTFV